MAMLTPMLSPSKARSSHSYLSHPIKQMRTKIKWKIKKRWKRKSASYLQKKFSKARWTSPFFLLLHEKKSCIEKRDGLTKARGSTLRKDGTRSHKKEAQNLPQIKSSSIYKGLKNLWSNSLHKTPNALVLSFFLETRLKGLSFDTKNVIFWPLSWCSLMF